MVKRSTKLIYIKTKKLFQIHDIDRILVSKRESYLKKIHSNILLGMMIMTALDHYV